MPQAKTKIEITGFNFTVTTPDTPECVGNTEASKVGLSYKLQGEQPVNINTGPPPWPPYPPPGTPIGGNPVLQMAGNGWNITSSLPGGSPTGFGMGAPWNNPPIPPAGTPNPNPPPQFFPGPRPNPVFERLSLKFKFPMFCTCTANQQCKTRMFQLEVSYNGSSHPKIKLLRSSEDDCPNYAGLNPNVEVAVSSSGWGGPSILEYEYQQGVTCPCPEPENSEPEDAEPEEPEPEEPEPEDSAPEEPEVALECKIVIKVEYNFRVRTTP